MTLIPVINFNSILSLFPEKNGLDVQTDEQKSDNKRVPCFHLFVRNKVNKRQQLRNSETAFFDANGKVHVSKIFKPKPYGIICKEHFEI